jgi:hypothetical protein
MFSLDAPLLDEACTLLVFGTPAAGKSTLISQLTDIWLRLPGLLDVSVVSDNELLRSLEVTGDDPYSPTPQREFRLTPAMRKFVATMTIGDVVAESVPGRIAVLELAIFEWQVLRDNLRLPEGRKSYAIFLSCSREVSLQRQHDRAKAGVFNAVLPVDVMDRFLSADTPRAWLDSQVDAYWEFDTGTTSTEEMLAELGELRQYGAKSLSHLYDLGEATRTACVSIERTVADRPLPEHNEPGRRQADRLASAAGQVCITNPARTDRQCIQDKAPASFTDPCL